MNDIEENIAAAEVDIRFMSGSDHHYDLSPERHSPKRLYHFDSYCSEESVEVNTVPTNSDLPDDKRFNSAGDDWTPRFPELKPSISDFTPKTPRRKMSGEGILENLCRESRFLVKDDISVTELTQSMTELDTSWQLDSHDTLRVSDVGNDYYCWLLASDYWTI